MKRYQATFSLGEIGEPGPTLEAAAEACVRWATSRDGAQARPLPLDRDVPATEGYFGTVRTLRDDESETARWGLESRVKDREEPEVLTWVTELVLVRRSAGSLDLTCTNSLECRDVVRPAMRAMTRPRIVADLIEKFGGAKQYKLSSRALVVTSEQVGRFVGILLAPDRTRPVVYVSARNRDDMPCIDADTLASQLAGTAHVFVGDKRFPSLELKHHLAQPLGCWDGAVRIYWPRMSSHDDPAEHPHWTARDIAEFNMKGEGRFAAYLLNLISRIGIQTVDRDACTIADIERLRHERERAIPQDQPVVQASYPPGAIPQRDEMPAISTPWVGNSRISRLRRSVRLEDEALLFFSGRASDRTAHRARHPSRCNQRQAPGATGCCSGHGRSAT